VPWAVPFAMLSAPLVAIWMHNVSYGYSFGDCFNDKTLANTGNCGFVPCRKPSI